MKTGILSTKNIERTIKALRASFPESLEPTTLLIPKTYRAGIDRTKYNGKGRPRKDDYILRDFMELFTK